MNKLDAMRYAGQVNQKAIEIAVDAARTGVRLSVLDELIEKTIRNEGCEPAFKGYKDFPGSACLSPNDVVVHGVPNDYVLQSCDLLTIDVGTKYQGYCIDAARTMMVDMPQHPLKKEEDKRKHHLIMSAENILVAELNVIKAGCTLMDIVNAAERTASECGVYVFPEWGGHQIGKNIHEELDGLGDGFIPNAMDYRKGDLYVQLQKRKWSYQLQEGQTICIEPVVTFGSGDMIIDGDGWSVRTKDGAYTAHTERCLAVTKDGYELLS